MRLNQCICLLAALAAGLIWTTPEAKALPITTLSITGAGSCTSGGGCGAGYTVLNANTITYTGAAGPGWTISLTATTNNSPGATQGTVNITNLVVTNVSAGPLASITILATGGDFSLPTGQFETGFGSDSLSTTNVVGAGGSVMGTSFFDPTDTGALANGTSCTMTIAFSNNCTEGSSAWSRTTPTSLYSVTQRLVITANQGQALNTTGDAATGAVPEPGTLVLFGSGLLVFLGIARKRNKLSSNV